MEQYSKWLEEEVMLFREIDNLQRQIDAKKERLNIVRAAVAGFQLGQIANIPEKNEEQTPS